MTKRTLVLKDAENKDVHRLSQLGPFTIFWREKEMTVAGPYKKLRIAQWIMRALNDISYLEEQDKA